MLWTDANVERLIELYRSFEFLYNPKLKDHKNRVKGQLAWQTIAEEFDTTGVYHQINRCFARFISCLLMYSLLLIAFRIAFI